MNGRRHARWHAGVEHAIIVEVGVADVDGCARMKQISKQQISCETFGAGERHQRWVREHGVVVEDEPEREFAVELVVELGPEEVVVEDAGPGGESHRRGTLPRGQQRKDVSLIEADAWGGTNREP